MPIIDLTGSRFGCWTVLKYAYTRGHAYWRCRCDCGMIGYRAGSVLKNGSSKSCGCMTGEFKRQKMTTHGEGRHGQESKEWIAWQHVKSRCLYRNDKEYQHYGGRGITVCDRWRNSYENFLTDMGRAPSPQHSIDRIDNNGNYEPANCRWATQKQQKRNKRTNVIITIDGITGARTEVCEKLGLSYNRITYFMRRGLTAQAAADHIRK